MGCDPCGYEPFEKGLAKLAAELDVRPPMRLERDYSLQIKPEVIEEHFPHYEIARLAKDCPPQQWSEFLASLEPSKVQAIGQRSIESVWFRLDTPSRDSYRDEVNESLLLHRDENGELVENASPESLFELVSEKMGVWLRWIDAQNIELADSDDGMPTTREKENRKRPAVSKENRSRKKPVPSKSKALEALKAGKEQHPGSITKAKEYAAKQFGRGRRWFEDKVMDAHKIPRGKEGDWWSSQ